MNMNTLLHLETSSFYKELIQKVCLDIGIHCHGVSSIEEGQTVLQTEKVQLIITAMELKDGTAEHFISSINSSRHTSVPIIVITGKNSFAEKKGCSLWELSIILAKNLPSMRLKEAF